jgi:hypothetical protein
MNAPFNRPSSCVAEERRPELPDQTFHVDESEPRPIIHAFVVYVLAILSLSC